MADETESADTTSSPASGDVGVPDAAVVSLADAVSHALDTQAEEAHHLGPLPAALPTGWVVRETRSAPGYIYYYNMETGISTWHSPAIPQQQSTLEDLERTVKSAMDAMPAAAPVEAPVPAEESRKRSHEPGAEDETSATTKKPKTSTSTGKPNKVRILHILKKHKDSRRPSSWRQAKITATKEEATEELQGLMEILQEESGEAQRATFEELARTESDCSSAKRGGDLGFFGPKKMQPKFEEASFALKIGELSGIVETSSGVHVLLRIG